MFEWLWLLLQKSVSEWMHKALQVELQDWQRDQEPDTDHEGFYHTSLPTIITQVNIWLKYKCFTSFGFGIKYLDNVLCLSQLVGQKKVDNSFFFCL